MFATVHSFSRSRNCASTWSRLVGGGASTPSVELLFALLVSAVFVLRFSAVFEFAGSLIVTRPRSFRFINRGARITAATEIARIPRRNAPAMPTTHGHTRRLGLTSPPGGTYALGGRYATAFHSSSPLSRGFTTVVSSPVSTGVSGVPSSIQKLRLGSVYVRLQVEQRFIADEF